MRFACGCRRRWWRLWMQHLCYAKMHFKCALPSVQHEFCFNFQQSSNSSSNLCSFMQRNYVVAVLPDYCMTRIWGDNSSATFATTCGCLRMQTAGRQEGRQAAFMFMMDFSRQKIRSFKWEHQRRTLSRQSSPSSSSSSLFLCSSFRYLQLKDVAM